MPVTLTSVHAAVDLDGEVCEDCAGTCKVVDDDGSISGVVGSLIPCGCAQACPECHDTGRVYGLWATNAEQEIYEEGFRSCFCLGGAR